MFIHTRLDYVYNHSHLSHKYYGSANTQEPFQTHQHNPATEAGNFSFNKHITWLSLAGQRDIGNLSAFMRRI